MKEQSAHLGRKLSPTKAYEAIVVDENDPSRKGCIRARVPILMDEIPDSDLPWARPRGWNHPFGQMAQKKRSVGVTSMFLGVPRRGNKVNLYFPSRDPHAPVYSADAAIDDISTDPVYQVNYPNRMGLRFPNGFQIVVDTQTNEIFFINPGDYHMTVFGDMNQTIVGNQQLIVTDTRGDVPGYILNDPNMSAKYLDSDPQGRIAFKGLLGRQSGSQHTIIKGNQTVKVHGNKREEIMGDYSIKAKNVNFDVGNKFDVDAASVDLA